MLTLIVNPTAGKGVGVERCRLLEEELTARGAKYQKWTSEYAGHAVALAKKAVEEGAECVVAIGGDGTISEVASQTVGTETALGVFPGGTGNDMAKSVGLPKDTKALVDCILDETPRYMDCGRWNGKPFFNVFGAGFDADISAGAEKYKQKGRSGIVAYGLMAFMGVMHVKTPRIKVTVDGVLWKDEPLILVDVANGCMMGGGMHYAPGAKVDDGLLDVLAVTKVSRPEMFWLLPQFFTGKHMNYKCCEIKRGKVIEVACDTELCLQIDGEEAYTKDFTVTVEQNALKVRR